MKHITLLFAFLISSISFSQVTLNWRAEANNGNWSVQNNWWNGTGTQSPPGNEIIRFNNNVFPTMNNNVNNSNRFQIFFDAGATATRTINGTSINSFFDFSGVKPKIENLSNAGHVIAFPIRLGFNPMEINPVNGNLTFNNTVNLQGNFLDIFGNNNKSLTFNGVISGTGGVTIKQNSTVTYNVANTYSGATVLQAGTLILKANLVNSDITVSSGATLVLDGDNIQIKSLTINSGGIVTVAPGKGMTITGNLTNNGTMTLQSTSTLYSSLIVNGTSTGNVNYERHVNITAPPGGSGNNDLVSAPVTGQTFGNFAAANPNIVFDPNDVSRKLFGPFNKTTGSYQIYDTDVAADANAILAPAIGYRAASTNNGNFRFTGVVNTGTVNIPILNSGPNFAKWNVIGNPYPSYIKLIDFLNANNAQFDVNFAAVYGYDGNASDGYTIWNLAYATANPNALITPGQGFIVASKPSGGTVTYTPNMRSTGTTDDFITGRLLDNGYVQLQMTSGSQSYSTHFYFNEVSTLGLDPGYDAGIYGAGAPAFAIFSRLVEGDAGIDMAIQSLPYSALDSEIIVPLGINATQGQQLTISDMDSTLPVNIEVYIEDNVANTSTLLNTGDFVFTPTTDLSGIGRFTLRFTNNTLSIPQAQSNAIKIFATADSKIVINGELVSDSQLSLLDVQGRVVLQTQVEAGLSRNPIDVSSVSSGIYIVSISNNNQQKTQKIIIK